MLPVGNVHYGKITLIRIVSKIYSQTKISGDMKFRYIVALCALCVCMMQPALAATGQVRDNATDYYNIAEVAISNGELDQAVEYFDMALAENTTLLSMGDGLMYTYKDKAGALTDLGRDDEALKTVNAGLIQFSNSSGLWNNKGYVLFKMGQYNDAVDAYIGRKVAAACAARMRKFQAQDGRQEPR